MANLYGITDYMDKSEPGYEWRDRPCHFTWGIEAVVNINYDKITHNVGHDLKETPNLLHIEGLLFLAYLKVTQSGGKGNVQDARQALREAEEYIERTEGELQTGYLSVALLNRMWIESKACDDPEVKRLLARLESLTLDDKCHSVIGAIKAAALSRLGPNLSLEATELFKAAVEKFPENSGFMYGAALMTGRHQRSKGQDSYENLDSDGKRLMDNEKKYWEKMIKIDDEYKLAMSFLGMNLCRRGGSDQIKGLGHLEQAFRASPEVQDVCTNLARGYNMKRQPKEAIQILQDVLKQEPYPANHHQQLAVCYMSCARQNESEREDLLKKALKHLDKCLALDKGHVSAMFDKAAVLSKLNREVDAKDSLEELVQNPEHVTLYDRVSLYFNYATLLSNLSSQHEHDEHVISLWHKVMTSAEKIEFQDKKSGEWQVKGKAKYHKEQAYIQLCQHYKQPAGNDLQLAVLYFQNFKFQEAEQLLIKLVCDDQQTSAEPLKYMYMYLARTYLKWGMEFFCLQKAKECFVKARESILRAKEQGLDVKEGRKLLADITLRLARSQKQLMMTTSGQEHRQIQSCVVESYRQAIRCGSLSSSRELLQLVRSGKVQVLSRWEWVQILAEINICCSQNTYLHTESCGGHSPEEYCEKVKGDIAKIMSADEFFSEAWKSHFAMEREILLKLFQTGNRGLEMDGRMEDPDDEDISSKEIVKHATTCCEALRKLLDRIIDKFEKTELKIRKGKKHYFPLILDGNDSTSTEEALHTKLASYFEIDMATHYPKLFQRILKIQPGPNSETNFLRDLFDLVNRDKHTDINVAEIRKFSPAKLARQCTDQVEEICNYFFDAIEESKSLREKVEQLKSEIKEGKHGKATELLVVLENDPEFIVRMGSTSKLLELMALIGQQNKHTYSTMVQGSFKPKASVVPSGR